MGVDDKSITEIEITLSDILRQSNIAANPLGAVRSKNFLIIFDHVEDKQVLADIGSHFNSSSYIISTTIQPENMNHFHFIEVKPLSDIYVLELFSRAAGRQLVAQERAIVRKIACQLGNLAFPLSIIANTLRNGLNKQRLSHTLQLLKERGAELSFFEENFTPIVNTFEALFRQLNDHEKTVLGTIASSHQAIFAIDDLKAEPLEPYATQWALFTLNSKAPVERIDEKTYQINPLLYRFLKVRPKEFDFSGLWKSTFNYTNELEPTGGTSEYDIRIYKIGNQLVLQSTPNPNENYFVARLTLDRNLGILTGTWEENSSPAGVYKGQIYYGAGQLLIDKAGKAMRGKIIEYNNDMEIIAGDWELIRTNQTNE